jgi:hypothetical protein
MTAERGDAVVHLVWARLTEGDSGSVGRRNSYYLGRLPSLAEQRIWLAESSPPNMEQEYICLVYILELHRIYAVTEADRVRVVSLDELFRAECFERAMFEEQGGYRACFLEAHYLLSEVCGLGPPRNRER